MKINFYKSKSVYLESCNDEKYEIKMLKMEGNIINNIEIYNGGGKRIYYFSPINTYNVQDCDYAITDSCRQSYIWKEKLEKLGYKFLGGEISKAGINNYLHIDHTRKNFSFGYM